jgi:four helix bundle protein
MFDFQKLSVYQKAKSFNRGIFNLLQQTKLDRIIQDQLKRASFSIMLNIAEGSGRFSNRDRRNFLVIARGSVFECAAIMEYLGEAQTVEEATTGSFLEQLEELSKMLYGLIKKLQ